MKLTSANVNVTNTVSVARLTLGNTSVSELEAVSLGAVTVNSSQITVGSTTVTPTAISTPQLVLGGSPFSGSLFSGIVNYQSFAANGTWLNPYYDASVNASLTGYEQVFIMMWGAGGGGASNAGTGANGLAGGGGACALGTFLLNQCNAVCNVVVGLGGSAVVGANGTSAANVQAASGGNSIFWPNTTTSMTAYGGGGAFKTTTVDHAGAGGGALGRPGTNTFSSTGGAPLGGAAGNPGGISTFGGGGGSNLLNSGGGNSIFGGGGGAVGGSTGGQNSIYGGAGGNRSGTVGTSVFGGQPAQTGSAIPGGGGAPGTDTPYPGGRGEVRVWVLGPGGTTAGLPVAAVIANNTILYGNKSILYTATTSNIPDGTTLYYTLNNSSQAVSSDFTTAVNGSIVVSSSVGIFSLTADTKTDADETLIMDVRSGSSLGTIVGSNTITLASSRRLAYTGGLLNSVSGGTIVGTPAGTAVGDIIIMFNDTTQTTTTAPTAVSPPGTGWSTALNSTGTAFVAASNYATRVTMYYKKAELADLTATYTSMVGATGSTLRVLSYKPRSDLTISSVANGTSTYETTNGDPVSQTISMTSATSGDAIIGIAQFNSSSFGAVSRTDTFSGGTGEITTLNEGGLQTMKLEIQDRNYSNITVDMTDGGNYNSMLTQYIKVTF